MFFSFFNEVLSRPWMWILAVLYFGLTAWALIHVILYKKDSRAAVGWSGLIILSPFIGSLLYYLLGINRINRKVRKLNRGETLVTKISGEYIANTPEDCSHELLKNKKSLFYFGENMNLSSFHLDTKVLPLWTGDEAYTDILNEIQSAKKSIALLMYIFNDDWMGKKIAEALGQAKERGVEVRVLIDDVGSGKFIGGISSYLKKLNISVASFLPVLRLVPGTFSNLRNHRKLIIIDGETVYTGGMNISSYHCRGEVPFVKDFLVKVKGSIAHAFQDVFVDDWAFTTGEVLTGDLWYANIVPTQLASAARVIPDAPGDWTERVRWQYLQAINSAQTNVRILTPYFIPTAGVIDALKSAALRGVCVEVVTPEKADHAFMTWAMLATISELVEFGVDIYLEPGPFNHSKLLIVDDYYVGVGSSNWDARSLKLNFELNMEIVDSAIAVRSTERFEVLKESCHKISLKELKSRPLWVRLRGGFVRLMSPYL